MRDERFEINVYINFVLYAVTGRMAEADDLMEKHGRLVRSVARYLAEKRSAPRAPLYRGVLVDDEQPLERDDRRRFMSWSEDRDVACWFASRESVISGYVVECRPLVRGVVLELAIPQRVLFHHSWADASWAGMAAMHPHIGVEGARQFSWSLLTQREVITDKVALPAPTPLEQIPHPPILELDRRLAPPWI